MADIKLTRKGYERLHAELRDLVEIRRPQVMSDLTQAREYGDIRENAEYEIAKRDQGLIEGRIRELEALLNSFEIIELPDDVDAAMLGTCVRVQNLETQRERLYTLVSEQEAHLLEDYLSVDSPLGKALLGGKAGEVATFDAPAGLRRVKILAIARSEEDDEA